MPPRRAQLRRDAREARKSMVVPEPIAPINEHFSKASGMGQATTGCLTVGAFFRSLGAVLRAKRRGR
jgi:hypothetical protein